jgi:hypothetical protein
MLSKLSRRFLLIGILSIVILTLLAVSAIPAMAAPSTTTTTTPATTPVSLKPTVTSVSPDSGVRDQKLAVTITGTNFTGATAVTFGDDVTVADFNVASDTSITADIEIASDAPAHARVVTVVTPSGRGVLKAGFTVASQKPAVTGVSPDSGVRNQQIAVTITGTNFTGATAVTFGDDVTVTDFKVASDTSITADIAIESDAPAHARIVTVTNSYGRGGLKAGFTVASDRPTITGVSPNTAVQGQTLTVTINGTHFTGATAIFLGRGVTVTDFKVTSDTAITADIVVGDKTGAGSRWVAVTGPTGKGALKAAFSVTKDETKTPAKPAPTTTPKTTPTTTTSGLH